MFGSRLQLNKRNTQEIEICGDKIELRNCIRYFGAFLDATLNFKEHKKRKCKTAMLKLFQDQKLP